MFVFLHPHLCLMKSALIGIWLLKSRCFKKRNYYYYYCLSIHPISFWSL